MFRTRIAKAAAVATLTLGAVALLPSAPVVHSATGPAAQTASVQAASADNLTWG